MLRRRDADAGVCTATFSMPVIVIIPVYGASCQILPTRFAAPFSRPPWMHCSKGNHLTCGGL